MKQPPAHSWVEVSERALVHNIRAHRRLLGSKTKLMTIVKSNAYGHGLELVARVCERSHIVDWLGVASLNEALTLRRAGITLPILVLSYYHPLNITELAKGINHRISFVVYEDSALKALARAARLAGKPALVHAKLETGMARLGVLPENAADFIKNITNSPYLKLEGVASHFATAESRNQSFLKLQLLTFKNLLKDLESILPPNIIKHFSCSAAITTTTQSHFDLVRLGIAFYGEWPSPENKEVVQDLLSKFVLKSALTWKTQVIEVQSLPRGVPVGYDCTYVTTKPTIMAVLPVGYWDGYDRKLGNQGTVLIHGVRCPIIGKICMNISMVDVSHLKNVRVGDEVVLIGKQTSGKSKSGKVEEVSADELAQKIGTINYEIVTRINPLLPRLLV